MSGAVTTLARVVLVPTGVAMVWLGYWAWGREAPAARSFAALQAAVGATAILLGVVGVGLPMYMLSWLVAFMVIPMALAVFSLEYYGLEHLGSTDRLLAFLTPAAVGAAGGVLVILGEPTFTPEGVGPAVGAIASGPPLVLSVAHALHQVGLYYAGGVMLVATGLVFQTVTRYEHLDTRLGLTLSFVGVWPWLAYLVTVDFPQPAALPVLAACYLASLGAAGLAAFRYGLFDAAPAAGNVGPDAVLAGLDDPVVVADAEGRIVRVNEAAERTFGVDRADVVGGPVEGLLGADADALRSADDFEVPTAEGKRRFQAAVSELTDARERHRGDAVVLHDVTERRTREERLGVLNRVLRHNLRNDMSAIIGHADLIAEDGADPESAGEGIRDAADGLVDLGDRARQVEEMMSVPRRLGAECRLAAVVEDVVEAVEAEYPAATYAVDVPPDVRAGVDERILRPVLRNLVENAVEHSDREKPRVEVTAAVEDDRTPPVALRVADDGPGIPDHERAVIDEGDESPLQHGSGLGLWAAHWGARRMGGELAFADREPRGSVVTVRLPPADAPAAGATGTPGAVGSD